MALHLTSLGDQESCGKMPDNCCIYQGDEFIAFEFLQQNKGLYYERTLFSLTKALSQVLFPALGDVVVLLCITAVVALPDCLAMFWISKKRGGVILLVHPPQVVKILGEILWLLRVSSVHGEEMEVGFKSTSLSLEYPSSMPAGTPMAQPQRFSKAVPHSWAILSPLGAQDEHAKPLPSLLLAGGATSV